MAKARIKKKRNKMQGNQGVSKNNSGKKNVNNIKNNVEEDKLTKPVVDDKQVLSVDSETDNNINNKDNISDVIDVGFSDDAPSEDVFDLQSTESESDDAFAQDAIETATDALDETKSDDGQSVEDEIIIDEDNSEELESSDLSENINDSIQENDDGEATIEPNEDSDFENADVEQEEKDDLVEIDALVDDAALSINELDDLNKLDGIEDIDNLETIISDVADEDSANNSDEISEIDDLTEEFEEIKIDETKEKDADLIANKTDKKKDEKKLNKKLSKIEKKSKKKKQKLDKKEQKRQDKLEKKKNKKARIGCFGIFVLFSIMIIVGCVYTVYDLIGRNLMFESVELELPNFIGLYIDEIEGESKYEQFDIQIENVYEEGKSTGIVLSQFPVAPRIVKEDSTVVLMVNTPPQPVQVPNVRNMTRSEVKDELKLYDLSVFFKTVEDATVPHDSVLYTEPSIGSTVLQSTTVTVYISRDPNVSNVLVPNLLDTDSLSEAINILNESGLNYNVPGNYTSGTVLAQSPQPGTYIARGASVTLTVSGGTTANVGTPGGVAVGNHAIDDGHAHNLVRTQIVAPSGSAPGYSVYSCTLCGFSTYGDWVNP